MEQNDARLTVFFEDPFWVGLYERSGGGAYEVCKITFGAEPRDQEVHALILERWRELRFSPAVPDGGREDRPVNPKRRQRQIQRQLQSPALSTKALRARQQQRAAGPAAPRRRTREEREAQRQRQLALRREKRREKHRGH